MPLRFLFLALLLRSEVFETAKAKESTECIRLPSNLAIKHDTIWDGKGSGGGFEVADIDEGYRGGGYVPLSYSPFFNLVSSLIRSGRRSFHLIQR